MISILGGLDIPAFFCYGDVISTMSAMFAGKRAVADRFDILNMYSPFNFCVRKNKLRPLPKYRFIDMSFEQTCLENAQNILREYPNVHLLWSGGVDSTLILASMKMIGYDIPILCTQESIDEAPLIYNCLKADKHPIELFANNLQGWSNATKGKMAITGESAPTTGIFIENSKFFPYLQKPYKDIVREYLRAEMQKYGVSNKVDDNLDIWEWYLSQINIEVNTVAEFCFSISFCLAQQYNTYRVGLMTSNNGIFEDKCIKFYETSLIQDYALSHYKDNLKKYDIYNKPENYKKASKQIIEKVYSNMGYEKKQKVDSLKHYYSNYNGHSMAKFIPQRILKADGTIDEYQNVNVITNKQMSEKERIFFERQNCQKYLKENIDKEMYLI